MKRSSIKIPVTLSKRNKEKSPFKNPVLSERAPKKDRVVKGGVNDSPVNKMLTDGYVFGKI